MRGALWLVPFAALTRRACRGACLAPERWSDGSAECALGTSMSLPMQVIQEVYVPCVS